MEPIKPADSLMKLLQRLKNNSGNALFDLQEDIDDLRGLIELLMAKANLQQVVVEQQLERRLLSSPMDHPAPTEERTAWDNWEDFLYFNSELFIEETISRNLDYETIQNKAGAPVDIVPCPKCGNTNTRVAGSYKRSADEAGISEYICNTCGKRFQDE